MCVLLLRACISCNMSLFDSGKLFFGNFAFSGVHAVADRGDISHNSIDFVCTDSQASLNSIVLWTSRMRVNNLWVFQIILFGPTNSSTIRLKDMQYRKDAETITWLTQKFGHALSSETLLSFQRTRH